jgi:Fe-S oxidoreductase
LRTRLIANISAVNKLGAIVPGIFNSIISSRLLSSVIKRMLGFAQERNIPRIYKTTLRRWSKYNVAVLNRKLKKPVSDVVLFIDEFTDYNDTEIGIITINLLNRLGYRVITVKHAQSGRTYLSKGLLKKARILANKNVSIFKDIVNEKCPLIGIEPSSILSFRDEYKGLVDGELRHASELLAGNVFTIDEFISREYRSGNIRSELFTTGKATIKLHGHCHQKSIASTETLVEMLSIPVNYSVEEIKSGCCGMAGSFGYEKEHYEISMKVGELILFPEIRKSADSAIIAAPGTSCRQQILDGTGVRAFHPVEVLYEALKK